MSAAAAATEAPKSMVRDAEAYAAGPVVHVWGDAPLLINCAMVDCLPAWDEASLEEQGSNKRGRWNVGIGFAWEHDCVGFLLASDTHRLGILASSDWVDQISSTGAVR